MAVEESIDRSATERRQAWIRAGAGVSLIAVLLGALAVFEQQAKPPAALSTASLPPAAATPAGEAPPQGAAPLPAESPAAATPPVGDAGAVAAAPAAAPPAVPPETTAAPEIAPAGQRQADEPPPAPAIAPAARGERLVLQSPPAEADAVPPARPEPAAARPAKSPGGRAYLLQLGVFGTPENAQALYAELQRQGVPARLETRVVAGPFTSRDGADTAREKLARAGLARGMLVRE